MFVFMVKYEDVFLCLRYSDGYSGYHKIFRIVFVVYNSACVGEDGNFIFSLGNNPPTNQHSTGTYSPRYSPKLTTHTSS